MTKPFKSKFLPYVGQIKAWRRAGKTWKEVAEELTAMGIKADAGNVCRVMGRIMRRPYPIGAEPEPTPCQPQLVGPQRPDDQSIIEKIKSRTKKSQQSKPDDPEWDIKFPPKKS
jgi:hypothetical protein